MGCGKSKNKPKKVANPNKKHSKLSDKELLEMVNKATEDNGSENSQSGMKFDTNYDCAKK